MVERRGLNPFQAIGMRQAGIGALMGDALADTTHAHATRNDGHVDDLAQVVICRGRFGDVGDTRNEINPIINVGRPGGFRGLCGGLCR